MGDVLYTLLCGVKFIDMNEIEKRLLKYDGSNPILRKLLSSEEIKTANKLVKQGKMQKGIADDRSGLVIYYAT